MSGRIKHTVCVTKADPVSSLDSRQETLFVLACKNAKGKTVDADIIAGIWNVFKDGAEVKRVDGGVQLSYYNDYTTKVDSTRELIKTRDGQCGAWCSFFVDMLKVHGIDHVNEGREIVCKATEGLMVKNWQFNTPSGPSTDSHPYVNMKIEPDYAYIKPIGYIWNSSEFTDLMGVRGHGRNNPASLFRNHFIVQIGATTYYDPSYGKTYTSVDSLDSEMAGFYMETTWTTQARQNLTTVLTDSSTIDIKPSLTLFEF